MNILASVLPLNMIEIGNFRVTYYAVFILAGALLALLISKHEYKKLGGEPGELDGLFVAALAAGIIGARIWFVIAEWNRCFAGEPWYKVFFIWEGGLAIQGGAISGITVGVLYVHFVLQKKMKGTTLELTDGIVPTILLAQAIGRIGNFFNREVYGKVFDYSNTIFAHFPQWFINQLTIESIGNNGIPIYFEGITDPATQMVHPLFLYEALINICGFLILFFVLHKAMKKILPHGFVCGAYFIWYGITRIVMEPWRNPKFIMGDVDEKMSSRVMAYCFLVIGGIIILLSFIFKIVNANKKKTKKVKKNENNEVSFVDEEIPLTRQEVGITRYTTPEEYRAHDFSGIENSDILSEEDIEKAKILVEDDANKVDDFIVVEGEKQEEPVEEKKEEHIVESTPVEEEAPEVPYEPKEVELEEGDVPPQSKINKFVEKNSEVEESILEGYRNPYSPTPEKEVSEEVNENVELSINPDDFKEEAPTFDGEKIINYKNGFGDSVYGEEERKQAELAGKNIVELEENDVEDQSKINKFVEKDPEVEESILEGYRNPYSPKAEKNIKELNNEEVEQTIDVDIDDEDVPEIGEPTLDFKDCPAPIRSDGTVSTPIKADKKKNSKKEKQEEVIPDVDSIPDSHQENEVVEEEEEEIEEDINDIE